MRGLTRAYVDGPMCASPDPRDSLPRNEEASELQKLSLQQCLIVLLQAFAVGDTAQHKLSFAWPKGKGPFATRQGLFDDCVVKSPVQWNRDVSEFGQSNNLRLEHLAYLPVLFLCFALLKLTLQRTAQNKKKKGGRDLVVVG